MGADYLGPGRSQLGAFLLWSLTIGSWCGAMRADSEELLDEAKRRIDRIELRVHRAMYRALLPVADLLTQAKELYELETGTGHGKLNPHGVAPFVHVAAERLDRSPSFVDRLLRLAQLDAGTRALLADQPKLAITQSSLLALCREPDIDRRRAAVEAFRSGGSRAFKKALERPLIEPVDVAEVNANRVREVMAAYQTARGTEVDQPSDETGAPGQAEPGAVQLETRVDACDLVHDDPLEFLKTFGEGWGSPLATDPGPSHQHESESPAKRARRDRALAVFEFLQGPIAVIRGSAKPSMIADILPLEGSSSCPVCGPSGCGSRVVVMVPGYHAAPPMQTRIHERLAVRPGRVRNTCPSLRWPPHFHRLTQIVFVAASCEVPPHVDRISGRLRPVMPKRKRPYVASPDQVKITRDGDAAIIQYADPRVRTTHFTIGRDKLATMTDADILAVWNDGIEATDEFIRAQDAPAIEIPVGKPQVIYEAQCDQGVPRGHVLRCVVETDAAIEPNLDETVVSIDDRDFTLREFVKMIGTFGGWGMRIEFVFDEEVHVRPDVEVREPDEGE